MIWRKWFALLSFALLINARGGRIFRPDPEVRARHFFPEVVRGRDGTMRVRG